MGSGITLKTTDPVDIPTPDANKITVFSDSTNADEPSYKDDAGAVHTLVGATGATGAAGPAGPPVLIEGEPGEDGLTIPGPAGASGGGGGGGTTSDVLANIPAPTTDGELFLPTDGIAIYRADGAAWSPWGPIFPLTTPIDGDFAWINQETASVSASTGGIYLSDVAGGAVVNDVRIRKKAAPATPYTITGCFLVDVRSFSFHQFGLLFREAATGELHTCGYFYGGSNSWVLASRTFDAPDGTATDLVNQNTELPSPVWLRIADDGVNRLCSISFDGQNFIQFASMGRTTTLTADEVGFFINVVNTSVGMAVNLISWAEG